MENKTRWKNPYAHKTAFDELATDEAKLTEVLFSLIDVYDSRIKAVRRQNKKGMADIKLDTHLVDRQTHMRQSANVAAKMVSRLGLNSFIPIIGMLGHDSGHPGGQHDGEATLTIIGILLNAGFFHHNAEGVDVLLSEDFIDKIIQASINCIDDPEKKKQVKNDKNFIKRLENDAWFFLDVVVGHDGEATAQEIMQQSNKRKKYKTPKEAVLNKVSEARRNNNYKCTVETLEAALAKPADVIAYLKSDMENAFRRGIIKKEFSEDYLKCIGELLFEKNGEHFSSQQRIAKAREYLMTLEMDKLRETKEDIYNEEGKDALNEAKSILQELHHIGIYTYNLEQASEDAKLVNSIVSKHIEKYVDIKRKNRKYTIEEINSEINKIRDYLHKMLKVRQSVVEQITEDIKQSLIDDYCKNTLEKFAEIEKIKEFPNNMSDKEKELYENNIEEYKKQKMKESMDFSKRVSNILYRGDGLKNLNYKEYVQFAKKEYQTNSLPKALYKTIKQCAASLVQTGVIRDKFCDKSIIARINDEQVKKAMSNALITEKECSKYKEKIGINEFKRIKNPRILKAKTMFKGKKILGKYELFKQIYAYTQRMGDRFARICEDVYYSIETTTKELVKRAIKKDLEVDSYLPEEEAKEIKKIRKELEKVNPNELEEYINEKIEAQRMKNFSTIVANRIAIEYVGGFGNEAMEYLLIKIGNLSKRRYNKEDKPADEPDKKVNRLIRKIYEEDNCFEK